MGTKDQPDLKNFKKFSTDLKDAQLMFKGERFDVRKIGTREVVIHPGAVVILPLLDDKNVIMIRNERFAVGEILWELPAGTLESGEQPKETAARELIEETGYEANQIDYLSSFYTTPGFCNERMFVYIAKDLKFVGQKLNATEKITVETLKWEQVLNNIENGEIHDGKTITTLLLYHHLYR